MRSRTTTRGVLLAALCAVTTGLALLALITGFSADPAIRTLEVLAVVGFGAMLIGGTIVLTLVRLAGWRSAESDFDQIVERAERLAVEDRWGDYDEDDGDEDDEDLFDHDDAGGYGGYEAAGPPAAERPNGTPPAREQPADDDLEFRALVRAAIDELPLEFTRALEHVAIVVSDGGAAASVGGGRRGAYGLYQGDTVARDYFSDRIVIFRDTLLRDFGHDPALLRAQVTRTVRHELAHHLGYGEDGVRRLGL